MKEKDILHCDCNNFFASCECLKNPHLKDKPVVVAGKVEDRKGVIIARNYIAKNFGISVGMKIFEAERLCRDLVVVHPHMDLYNEISCKIREIYIRFTDRVESFSIDECFLDVTHSKIFGTPQDIADKIRKTVREEIGITISVGVSFNKTFAKIGSDLKKPDATSIITRENFKTVVWSLPVADMIGVGRHILDKCSRWGIKTIGDLANFPKEILSKNLGKVGIDLYNQANGIDDREVSLYYDWAKPKSIGNSATFYRDLKTRDEVLMGLSILCENITKRMIKQGLERATTIHILVKDNNLMCYGKQCKLPFPCRDSKIFAHTAFNIFMRYYDFKSNVRLLGVSVTGFVDDNIQINMFERIEASNLDELIMNIRGRYGYQSIGKASRLLDSKISEVANKVEFFKEIKEIRDIS